MITDERLLKIERHPKYPRLFKQFPFIAPLTWVGSATYNYSTMLACQFIEIVRVIAANVFDCSVDDFVYSDGESIDFNLFPEAYPIKIRIKGELILYFEISCFDIPLLALKNKKGEETYFVKKIEITPEYSSWDLYAYLPSDPFIEVFEEINEFCKANFRR